jgi:large subunit ribosomal protein L18
MRPEKKLQLAQRRHWRVRKKVHGTPERPRMSVCFTNQHIYVQFIDDEAGRTLAAVSTRSKAATAHGKLAAEVALARGIKQVVFDRGSARYHWSAGKDGQPVYGKVAALAQAAREAGLQF